MNFAIRIDDEAATAAPEATRGAAEIIINDDELRMDFGALLHLAVPTGQVANAAPIPDPRPSIFLPIGVSAAVEQLGRDVVCVIGAYDGLVRIDFHDTVQAETRPAGGTPDAAAPGQTSTVALQHLIVSLEDPDAFVAAVQERRARGEQPIVPPGASPVE